MAAKKFDVGDLVWAKMKGFPYWPARIVNPPQNQKSTMRKPQHYVYFFGTKDYAWIMDIFIEPHSEEMLRFCYKRRPSTFRNAVDEILRLAKKVPKKSFANVKIKKEEEEIPEQSLPIPEDEVKYSTILKSEKPIKEEKLEKETSKRKASERKTSERKTSERKTSERKPSGRETSEKRISEKRVSRKRTSGKKSPEKKSPGKKSPGKKSPGKKSPGKKSPGKKSSGEKSPGRKSLKRPVVVKEEFKYSPPAKVPKVDDFDFSSLLNNFPPGMSYSRIAVIRPYDDCTVRHHASNLLRRGEYVERPKTPEMDINKISEYLLQKNITATPKKIGFLGLGMMGRGIVKNLLNSGHDVTVWNRSTDKCIPFQEANAKIGQTPADVVANCDITFCCVTDPDAAKVLVFGNCGVLQGLQCVPFGRKGYVQMTTIDPLTSLECAEAIIQFGGKYLEAPLSGSRQLAEDGALLILASGDQELFDECKTCFAAISKMYYYIDRNVGNSSKMNLVLSMFLGSSYAALAEAMALLERLKLSQGNFLKILDLGPFGCATLIDKGRAMVDRNFTLNTDLKLQQKDLDLTLTLSNSVHQPMQILAAANELFKRAKLLRYSDHDVSAVLYGAKY